MKEKTLTLSKAIQLVWSRDKLEALAQELERYRKLLHLEVLHDIKDTVAHSAEMLQDLSIIGLINHKELTSLLRDSEKSMVGSLDTVSQGIMNQLTRLSTK